MDGGRFDEENEESRNGEIAKENRRDGKKKRACWRQSVPAVSIPGEASGHFPGEIDRSRTK